MQTQRVAEGRGGNMGLQVRGVWETGVNDGGGLFWGEGLNLSAEGG